MLKEKYIDILLEITFILVVLFITFTVNRSNYVSTSSLEESDIFYEYSAAININNGINPYQKILGGSLVSNNKYATLFPLYYYFLLGIALFSKFSFIQFIDNYRVILFLSEIFAFIFTYLLFRRINKKLLGFTAATFLILNRWAINNFIDVKQDMIAIAILMASFYFFYTKRRFSYLLYGLSLGIKHIGIFVFPFYLLPLIYKERKVKEFAQDMAALISPIFLSSIYYVFTDIKAFILSLLFSFTRAPSSSSDSSKYGFDRLLVIYKASSKPSLGLLFLPRLPLVIMSAINFFLLLTKRIPKYTYLFFSIFLFITFNPVYFDQYLLWLTPFVLFCVFDFYNK